MPNYVPGKELIIKRLNRHTTIVDGHWLFTGHRTRAGYGRIKIKRCKFSTIRLSLVAYLQIDYYDWSWQANHIDNCKYRNCWNPEHLYKGTHSENIKDTVRLKTHKETRKTHCPHGHPLDRIRGNGKRYCGTCNRERAKRANA